MINKSPDIVFNFRHLLINTDTGRTGIKNDDYQI